MNEIRYETPMEKVDWQLPSIFLAGPSLRSDQTHLTSWRFEAVELLRAKRFTGNVIIPEFASRLESYDYKMDIPIWEFKGLCKVDVILFWIPRTRELIGLTTNHEHGYWLARDPFKMVYGRPDDAYRVSYLDIMWRLDAERRGQTVYPIQKTLNDTVDAALIKMTRLLHSV